MSEKNVSSRTRAKSKQPSLADVLSPSGDPDLAAGALKALREKLTFSAKGRRSPLFDVLPDSEDEGAEEEEDKDDQPSKYSSDSRIAAEVYRRTVAGWGSLTAFIRQNKWNSPRNFHEARRLVQIAESAIADVGLKYFLASEWGEMSMRNIAGISKSDEWNKPSLMEQFEWAPPQDIVPRDFLRMLVKDSARNDRMKPKKTVPPVKGGAGK